MIVLGSLHPAFLLRSAEGAEGQSKFFETVLGDIRRAMDLRYRRPSWDESVIWERASDGRFRNLYPTVDEVFEFCRHVWNTGQMIAVDVETTGEEPLASQLICVGMASEDGRAICVPILSQGGARYWNEHEEWLVRQALAYLLGDARVPKVFHNGSFDTVVLWSHGLQVRGWVDDTMQAHHVLDGEMPHGLAFVSSTILEVPYWKDDVKGDHRWLDLPDVILRSYNLRDNLTTIRIRRPLLDGLARENLLDLYREEVELAHVMAKATIRGLEVDQQRLHDTSLDTDGKPKGLAPRLRLQRDEALAILQEIAGSTSFNPRSPMHLRFLLFDLLKFPIVAKTKKGAPSTDKNAMVLLALSAETPVQQRALRALIDYRQADKMLGTWVEGLPILADGRVHPSWKLLPVTGRFSTSPNVQNFNKYIKRIFRSANGRKYVSVDLSQAELRVMAYLSGDPELLRMYEQGINVHTVNASLLFQVKCPKAASDHINLQTEAYLREMCPKLLGLDYDGLDENGQPLFPEVPKAKWKSIRTLAKNFVFGDNYGAEAETLYQVIRSKRDPDTNELLFPDVELAEIEALKVQWERLHPWIPRWWRTISESIQKAKKYRCPISGRTQWFRGGFKRNEMLNRPIQSFVASWVNKQMIQIARALEIETGDQAWIALQVHDAITVESPDELVPVCSNILSRYLNQPFSLPGYPRAELPADAPTVGTYLDEV